ncbi:MAG: hypothetical protein PHN33_06205 [Candidatus Peribacteraceae bacterium]|nr:hypothetical protein [Candidatus Peribacteraceae bacterium]
MKNRAESSTGDGRKDFNEFRQLIPSCVPDALAFCKQSDNETKLEKTGETFIHAVAELLAVERIDRLSKTVRDSLIRHDFLGTIGILGTRDAIARTYDPNSPFASRLQQLKRAIETKIGGNEVPTPQSEL